MKWILFEDESHDDLLPFSFTRPIYELRAGIFTFRERWARTLGADLVGLPYDYLQAHFGQSLPVEPSIWVNGKSIPHPELIRLSKEIAPNSFYHNEAGEVWMAHFSPHQLPTGHNGLITQQDLEAIGLKPHLSDIAPQAIRWPEDLFLLNGSLIAHDIRLLSQEQKWETLNDPHTRVYGRDNLFVSPGVKVRAAILNAEDGPIYLGPGVEIQEGAIIRRPHAICEGANVSMGARLRGDSTIGPYSKIGGEVANSILMGYSNKGHEGYLGNSVVGHWCNIGADSNSSNLKNNYASVKLWHYPSRRFRDTGRQFCGLMMGDHSKCAINTMFNTGSVIGVSTNLFGSGFPRAFIPSFSWGGPHGMSTYRPARAFQTAEMVMARRNLPLSDSEKQILQTVFDRTASYRSWDAPR